MNMIKYEDYIIGRLQEKIQEIPELIDVIEQLSQLSVNESRQVKIEIVTKDFSNSTNTTYEKIIKRGL